MRGADERFLLKFFRGVVFVTLFAGEFIDEVFEAGA